MFARHLIAKLCQWGAKGEKIILFADLNEHLYQGRIAKLLAGEDLGVEEACLSLTGQEAPSVT